jgi:O-antigen ligase
MAHRRSIVSAGLIYIGATLFHIPDNLFRHGFDKDAPAQFAYLMVAAAVYAIYIAVRPQEFVGNRLIKYGLAALILSQLTSLIFSGSLVSSLIGDSGRFVGVATTLGLATVAVFHSRFSFEDFRKLALYYVIAVELVALVGIAQRFNLVELPGDQGGIASTLGNTDFFAALVATSFPLLIFTAIRRSRNFKIVTALFAAVNLIALYLAGPLQAYVDIALILVGLGIYRLRRFIPQRQWSLNARTYLGTFAVIIWAEVIFLMPFLGSAIPVLGNDVQVKIRSNFWLDGMRQFFSHPLFGVGPDQYGNSYEQYRTLDDVVKYSNILSNDAHSSPVQTLATLGIFGTLAYIFLISLLIRSLLILWDRRTFPRVFTYLLGLYIAIYLTNSFISPITISHKYLFWAVAGFVIGSVYSTPRESGRLSIRAGAALLAVTSLIVGGFFVHGQLNYLTNIEKYAADNSVKLDYMHSAAIPCFMYFDAEMLMVAHKGSDESAAFAEKVLDQNPRCVAAVIFLAKTAVNNNDALALKKQVYRLIEIAPVRSETISIGMYYANRTGDQDVKLRLERVMKALNLIYVPGALG